jgi:gamma-glutamylcyclotransferase (GGCT)/AIG2-like uncharacterized protein YtfP
MDELLPIFVYGTLQRGQERERLWPQRPLRVEEATTVGRLYDLGPYPALVPGDDVVEGELWYVAAEDLSATLKTLDRIEEYSQGSQNLYERRAVRCRNVAGQIREAYAYFYAREADLAGKSPLPHGANGCCRWRRA